MSTSSTLGALFWLVAVVALIPLALWLLKRSGAAGTAGAGPLRTVAVLPLSQSQRLVTIEVGRGDARRWLVLGVSPQHIATLHEMAPQDGGSELAAAPAAAQPFAQLLARMQGPRKGEGDASL